MPVHVALLRAVNVGGRSVAMSELRAMLETLGLDEPRTLLQSGNAVFGAARTPRALEALLEKAAAERFGFATEFFVRSAREWDAVLEANPFPREARDDPSHLLVLPLKSAPAAAAVKALRDAIRGSEVVEVVGRCLYAVYPDGIGRSKLTNAIIESRLGTRCTGRNWNTAQKLAAMMRGE
jgi:uncharacterized protein (DUF1697 family)